MGEIKGHKRLLTEPVPVNDDFVQELAAIESHGANIRLIFCVDDTLHEAGSTIVRKVQCKLIIPRDNIAAIVEQLRLFMAAPEKPPLPFAH